MLSNKLILLTLFIYLLDPRIMKVLLGLLGYSCKIHRKLSKSNRERLSLSEGDFDRSFSSEKGPTEFDPKDLPSKDHPSNPQEKLSSSRMKGEGKAGSETDVSSTDQSGVENNKSADQTTGCSFLYFLQTTWRTQCVNNL